MELTEVNPDHLTISDQNERRENVDTSKLRQSVEEQGVLQPPLVRQNGSGETYEVVAGQRRVLAAQEAGLEAVPVLIADWDDQEAIRASITENFESFRNDVSSRDRAKAILRMAELADENGDDDAFRDDGYPSPSWVADQLGTKRQTVQDWVERLRPEWRNTEYDVRTVSEDTDGDQQSKRVQEVGGSTLREVRNATGGGETGEKIASEVTKGGLSQEDVREINRFTEHISDDNEEAKQKRAQKAEEAVEKLKESKEGRSKRYKVRLNGDLSNGVAKSAQQRGTSEEQIIRNAVERYLESEGLL